MLSGGRPVQAAGQIVIIKNYANEVDSIIITNASGNYKPEFSSLRLVENELRKILSSNDVVILQIQGEPISTQAMKLFFRASKSDPKLADPILTEIRDYRNSKLISLSACDAALTSASLPLPSEQEMDKFL